MQANLLFDVFHQEGNITLLAYYCSETQKKAWSVKVELNGEHTSFPVQWEQRTDFEKRYGQASNSHWYSLSLAPALFYNTLLHPEAIVTLMDESLKEVPLPLGLITNKSELDKRIIGFLRETNRFVLHPHEQARAMAYCLALQRLANHPFLNDEAQVVHLWSHVVLAAKQAGWNLPDVNSFQALEATCYRHWGNDPAQYGLVLLRLSSAYGFEAEMVDRLEALVSPTEDGAVERRHLLSVLYLKRLLNTPRADLGSTYAWPAERVSRLFKQTLWAAPTYNMGQADMAEKMSLTCAVYHRIYHFKTGQQAVGFREGELQNIARRLHQASCGLLGLGDIQDFLV